MKIDKARIKKIISILMCLVMLSTLMLPIKPYAAATSFEVYFNGSVVGNGGSIHYTSSPVTIGIKPIGATDFYAIFSGTTGPITLTLDDGGYNEYTFDNPSGPVIFNVVADGVPLPSQTINFYHDTVIDPGASLSYVSVKARINSVNSKTIPQFDVDYDGYNNTGVNKQQVGDSFPSLGYTTPGTYQLGGKLQVAVFVNGTLDGYYWADDPILYSKYTWGVALTKELQQRQNWGASEYIEPNIVQTGSLTVRYKDNTTHAVIAAAKIDTGLTLPTNPTAVVNNGIPGYNANPTSYMLWYGTEDMAGSQTKQPYSSAVIANLNDTQLNGFVYYFHDQLPPVNGRINVTQVDVDTGTILGSKTIDNITPLPTLYPVSNSIFPTPANGTYDGANIAYTNTTPSASLRDKSATSQSASLTDTQKEAWIYFYYKISGPSPTPSPTPTPTPAPTNKPPVAKIDSLDEVMQGDDINIFSGSYDPDGYIASYSWNVPDAKIPIIGFGTTTWFDKTGYVPVGHSVTDNGGLSASTSKSIKVLPANPIAVIDYKGRLKENYKITLDAAKSKSSKRYPIDFSKTVWQISAVSGCTDADIKYLGGLTGMATKDFLVKKTGRIKVTLTVTNTLGYTDTTYTYLDISPNLPPVAQLSVPKRSIREFVDANGNRYGETTVYDTSYSPDGDKIYYRKYYVRYDSNNDGKFDNEFLDKFYEGTVTQATKRYYNDQGVGLCRYDIEVEEDLMEKDSAGNYINTIPEFILPEDIKKVSTFYVQ